MSAHPWGEVVAELDLCTGPATVGGYTFTCASKADNTTTFVCTGGHHVAPGRWIRCTCTCHRFDPQQVIREAIGDEPLTGGVVWGPHP